MASTMLAPVGDRIAAIRLSSAALRLFAVRSRNRRTVERNPQLVLALGDGKLLLLLRSACQRRCCSDSAAAAAAAGIDWPTLETCFEHSFSRSTTSGRPTRTLLLGQVYNIQQHIIYIYMLWLVRPEGFQHANKAGIGTRPRRRAAGA